VTYPRDVSVINSKVRNIADEYQRNTVINIISGMKLCSEWPSLYYFSTVSLYRFHPDYFPMFWGLPKPLDTRVLISRIHSPLHPVTSASSPAISSSICFKSVSISSSGRGGVYW